MCGAGLLEFRKRSAAPISCSSVAQRGRCAYVVFNRSNCEILRAGWNIAATHYNGGSAKNSPPSVPAKQQSPALPPGFVFIGK
jgi:hypothetical protein